MFFYEYLFSLVVMVLLIVMVLLSVAFLTLMERKILGYIQIRKGPNKVGYLGFLQPFSDAIKLFTKEQTFPIYSNYLIYYFSPVFSMFMSLLVWILAPYLMGLHMFNMGVLFMFCCLSLGVYGIMLAGWSSNSLYSMLGGLRSISQTISYEVSLSLIIMSYIIMVGSLNFIDFFKFQFNINFFFLSVPLCLIYLISCLAETNRCPFDFSEGESELVSGFNVEYSSGGFALIFMAEYSSILFMSFIFSVLFLGSDMMGISFYLYLVLVSFFFIWVRGTLPRYRYDKLMFLCWKSFLPVSLNFMYFFIGLKIFFCFF